MRLFLRTWCVVIVVIIFLSSPLYTAFAQNKSPFPCYAQAECVDTGKLDDGNCDDKRCWVQGDGCTGDFGRCYVKPEPIKLQIHIGDTAQVLEIGNYIAVVYNFMIGLAGLVGTIAFMVGGLIYLTAGDSERVKKAKDIMIASMSGLAVALGAYVILQTINPDTLSLQPIKIDAVQRSVFTACSGTELCHPCGVEYQVLQSNRTGESGLDCNFTVEKGKPIPAGFTASIECVGRGCKQLSSSCNDTDFRCGRAENNEQPPTECRPSGSITMKEGFICKGCSGEFQNCHKLGPSDECCGGFCGSSVIGFAGTGKCSSGTVGSQCNNNNQCATGLCQTNLTNRCSTGSLGSPCSNNNECRNNLICQTGGKNFCATGTIYSPCSNDNECVGGLKCLEPDFVSLNFDVSVCVPNETFFLKCDLCNANMVCQENGTNFCTFGRPGNICSGDNECLQSAGSRGCAKLSSFTGVCTAGEIGDACDSDTDCKSHSCASPTTTGLGEGRYSICVSGDLGSFCDDDSDCNGGLSCQGGFANVGGDGRCLKR